MLIYTGIALALIVGILAGNLFIFNKIADNVSSGDPIPVIYITNIVTNPLINLLNNTMADFPTID